MLPARTHCQNLQSDRDIGAYWERQFCLQAARFNKSFTPMQLGRKDSIVAHSYESNGWKSYTLPDITIWTAPGEHHEIKHKAPFNAWRYGDSFGLEVYRFEALLWFAQETGQDVMYTIHDHSKTAGRDATVNKIEHWITASVLTLNRRWHTKRPGQSWVNGQKKEVDIYYWSIDWWQPLLKYWNH